MTLQGGLLRRRKWKKSTAGTNEDRFAHHLTSEFAARSLRSFTVDELKTFSTVKLFIPRGVNALRRRS